MQRILLFTTTVLTVVLLASCSKAPKQKLPPAQAVAGTYQGSLKSTSFKTTSFVNVDPVNDSTVSIHCFDSAGFDTTFVTELFQNGQDSIMLSSTGQDFYNQYGHYMYSMMGSMMGGYSGMMDWQQFLSFQHDPGNGHYGSFDMMNGTFYYPFTDRDSTGTIAVTMAFNGNKH